MCGIVGHITSGKLLDLSSSIDLLRHRGPDGSGQRALDLTKSGLKIALGQTRLAIVDLREMPKPYDFTASTGVVLAYNGEIYNWREIRNDLSDGTAWETDCDAEVIARAWRHFGPEMLDYLNGMFAFCLVDTLEGQVFLARDRAGEKPLYYTAGGSDFLFASEIKAIPRRTCIRPHRDWPEEYDVLEFDCLARTPFVLTETPEIEVRQLLPGHAFHFKSFGDIADPKPIEWWRLPQDTDPDLTYDDAVELTGSILMDAIAIRAEAEVPSTVALSGGLDSAIIQALARVPKVYTVTFDEPEQLNVLGLAEEASADAEVVPVTFDLAAARSALPTIAWHLDTPATWSALAHWFLAGRMAQDGVKILLSGEGADELFGGYTRYRMLWWIDHLRYDPLLTEYRGLTEYIIHIEDIIVRMINRGDQSMEVKARQLIQAFTDLRSEDLPRALARLEWHTTMQCLLRMADRMYIAWGIENRAPFLDHRLIELAARMPTKFKINRSFSKRVLREVALRLEVPEIIVHEKTKKGLAVPWPLWIDNSTGLRGVWDRRAFRREMETAWRSVYDPTIHPPEISPGAILDVPTP